MNTNILLMVASIFYLLLVFVLYFSKKKVNTFETKIYKYIIIVAIFGALIDLAGVYISVHIPYDGLLRRIVLHLFYSYLITILYLFSSYMFISGNVPSLEPNEKNKFMVFSSIYVFILGISFFLPVTFGSVDGDVFAYGPIVWFLHIVIGALLVVWLIYFLNNIKHMKMRRNIPMLVFLFLLVPIVYSQMIHSDLLLMSGLISFITVVMYHTIENPDLKLATQMKLARDQAEKANQAKADFLSIMSHEIRTPLSAIKGFSELSLETMDIKEAHENAKEVVNATEILLEVVNGVLNISSIETNDMENEYSEYNLVEIINNVSKLLATHMKKKGLDYHINVAKDLPTTLYGDAPKIQQVLLNLLTNAVKYTNEGHIKLNVQCINKGKSCGLFISVEDSGRGLKTEEIENIFNEFSRLDETKNATVEETGLGLSIAKQLVEMMNGKITAQGVYGEGSQFTVTFNQEIKDLTPNSISVYKQDEKVTSEEEEIEVLDFGTPAFTKVDMKDKKVLCVDDNQLNLKIITRLLKDYNLDITVCDTPFEVLDRISNNEIYDLLLVDDTMPKMTGTEMMQILKGKGYNKPIVALTANAKVGDKEKYLKAGFEDYIAKPIDRKELDRVLKAFIK